MVRSDFCRRSSAAALKARPAWNTAIENFATVSGNVTDLNITYLNLDHNGNLSTVPVVNGNFSRAVNLTGISNITFSTVDSVDTPRSAALLLDGDIF